MDDSGQCDECYELSEELFLGLCPECWEMETVKHELGLVPFERDREFDDD